MKKAAKQEVKPAIDKHGLNPEERRIAQLLLADEVIKPTKPVTCYFAADVLGCKVEVSGPAEAAIKLISLLKGSNV